MDTARDLTPLKKTVEKEMVRCHEKVSRYKNPIGGKEFIVTNYEKHVTKYVKKEITKREAQHQLDIKDWFKLPDCIVASCEELVAKTGALIRRRLFSHYHRLRFNFWKYQTYCKLGFKLFNFLINLLG